MSFYLRIHVVFESNSTNECLETAYYLTGWAALCRQLVFVGRCSSEPFSPSLSETVGSSLSAGSALSQALPPPELWKPLSLFEC